MTQQAGSGFCDRLKEILTAKPVMLFAGAGVSVHAGLPDWKAYLAHLTEVAEKYEPATANLMRIRVNEGFLDEAARYYKLSKRIPAGDKYGELAGPFKKGNGDSTKLLQLVKLPFKAIVTTNYDCCLHDAWAAVHKETPTSFELDDGSLKQAGFYEDRYIARIHGRALKPESMIIDTDGFESLEENEPYRDFLYSNVFTRNSCVFVGFSFVDPAIGRILELVKKFIGPTFPKKHYALLPTDTSELAVKLASLNIEIVSYGGHDNFWRCVEGLPEKLVGVPRPKGPEPSHILPLESMRRFLANCYVRSKLSAAAVPLRELVIQGLVLGILEQGAYGTSKEVLISKLKEMIALTREEAHLVTERAIDGLSEKGWISNKDGVLALPRQPEKLFEKNVGTLVSGVMNRLLVREGLDSSPMVQSAITQTLEETFLARGFDLGAQFAGKEPASSGDLLDLLRRSLRRLLPSIPFDKQERLAAAIYDLIRKPDRVEAEILSGLARVSFGLSIILKMGSSALRLDALPERLFFDSNVLMCAVTEGHPLKPVYEGTLQKLTQTAAMAGKACQLLVIREFLNEIVSHRKLATKLVEELQLEIPENLEKHVVYYGAENTNVFVGAYATWVGRKKEQLAFRRFLEEVAPYESEAELASFLERFTIRTLPLSATFPIGDSYKAYFELLTREYALLEHTTRFRGKPDVLVDHEAKQLSLIEAELSHGRKSFFVTADKNLRGIVTRTRIGSAWHAVLSHYGLLELVDLLVGVELDPQSLSRFLWGIVEIDEQAALRDYFIERALKRYDEALVMSLPEIVDDFVQDTARAAEVQKISFYSRNVEDKAKAAKFLDRYEEQFFTNWAELVRLRRQQRG